MVCWACCTCGVAQISYAGSNGQFYTSSDDVTIVVFPSSRREYLTVSDLMMSQ